MSACVMIAVEFAAVFTRQVDRSGDVGNCCPSLESESSLVPRHLRSVELWTLAE